METVKPGDELLQSPRLLTSSEVELMETVNELCPIREYQSSDFLGS